MTKPTKLTKPVTDKKEMLLEQLKKIQSKIDNLDTQRADKINKLAKKHKLFDLSDSVLEKEFALIKEKYASNADAIQKEERTKKN